MNTFRLLMLLVLVASCAEAQQNSTPIEIGRRFRLQSRVLGETRTVDVTLPARYDSTSDRYPVIVVLDGEYEHLPAVGTVRFYSTMSMMPPAIIVGVHNTDRMRDMTTPPSGSFRAPPEAPGAGGADRFLGFLAEELLPFIDSSYRAAPMRVLIGHSLTGLLVVHAVAQRPELFTGWIALEPSVWWNDQAEMRRATAMLQSPAGRQERFMAVNMQSLGLDTTGWGGNRAMVRQLDTEGETHSSMALAGMMMGLRTIFADFRPRSWRAGMRPIEMLDHYDSLAVRIGYSPPVPASAYSLAVRMSLDGRHFDDAERGLARWEQALGPSDESRRFRARLGTERNAPPPAGWIALEVPVRRPTPGEARRFLGRWESIGDSVAHLVTIRASGDTIVVRDRIRMRGSEYLEEDDPVIQVTADGTLEWGLQWYRGLAALVVLKGRLLPDGTMEVRRESRGWVPRDGGGPDANRVQRFRRVQP